MRSASMRRAGLGLSIVAALSSTFVLRAAPAGAALTIQVSPTSGPAGTQITVSGVCTRPLLPPIVTITALPAIVADTATVNPDGNWQENLTIPAYAQPGDVLITATATCGPTLTESTTFTVTAAPATTTTSPPPAAPTTAAPTTTSPASNPGGPGAPGSPADPGDGDGSTPTNPSQPVPGSPTSAPAGGSTGGGSGGSRGSDGGGADDPGVITGDGGEPLQSDSAVAARAAELRDRASPTEGGGSGGGPGWLAWMLVALVVGAASGAAAWYRLVKPEDAPAEVE